MPVCLIGLGSNQGNRQEILDAAVARLAEHPQIKVVAHSAWRETAPIGGPAGQALFLNGAVKLQTSLAPHDLLLYLRKIEDQSGRRREERWGPRPLDLDLLLYDELTLDTPTLVLPHPRMAWRRFVLEPAAEVAGSMRHPTIGWSIARLLEHLDTAAPYVAVTGPIASGKTHLAERLAAAISGRLIVERPDWLKLEAFYADPAGQGWEMELEFLRQRVELLEDETGERRSGIIAYPKLTSDFCHSERSEESLLATEILRCAQNDNRSNSTMILGQQLRGPSPFSLWTVSDFWFDQSAAFARAWLPAEQLETYYRQYEKSRQKVTRPKLIVLLDAPADELLSRVRRRGRDCERPLTEASLDRIRQEIGKQTCLPDVGPVLRIDHADSESAFTEVLAAVRGME